jgi:hypothetical protein
MAAAIALAVVLVVAVAGMSLAMQTQQRPADGQRERPSRAPRTPPITPRRVRERRAASPAPPPEPVPFPPPSEGSAPKLPEILRSGVPAQARVINVVDERVVGPVTRSRLTLEVRVDDHEAFEVSLRHAFPTPEARSRVRVGGTVPVRYDRDDHHRVVLDPDGGGPDGGVPDRRDNPAATAPRDRAARPGPRPVPQAPDLGGAEAASSGGPRDADGPAAPGAPGAPGEGRSSGDPPPTGSGSA